MKTTLNFDDDLLRAAKKRAAEDGETLTRVIERALRLYLNRVGEAEPIYRLRPLTKSGRPRPGVDLDDRDALHRRMDEPE